MKFGPPEPLMSMLLLGAGSSGAGAAPPPSYERTAFLSSTGNDGTAVLNNPALPFETLAAAQAALATAHAAEACTIALLTAFEGSFYPDETITLTLKGHEAVRVLTGDIYGAGTDNSFTPDTVGGNGKVVNFDAIELVGTYDGTGGAGGYGSLDVKGASGGGGASFSAINGSIIGACNLSGGPGGQGGGSVDVGADGGDGGNGGNATVDGTSYVTNFTSGWGAGGAGGSGGSGSGNSGVNGTDGSYIAP